MLSDSLNPLTALWNEWEGGEERCMGELLGWRMSIQVSGPQDTAWTTPTASLPFRGGRGSGVCVTLDPPEAGRGTQVMGTSHRAPTPAPHPIPTTSPNNWHPGSHIRGDGELHRLGQGTSFNLQGSKRASAWLKVTQPDGDRRQD